METNLVSADIDQLPNSGLYTLAVGTSFAQDFFVRLVLNFCLVRSTCRCPLPSVRSILLLLLLKKFIGSLAFRFVLFI